VKPKALVHIRIKPLEEAGEHTVSQVPAWQAKRRKKGVLYDGQMPNRVRRKRNARKAKPAVVSMA
jgi:hypothetical protein